MLKKKKKRHVLILPMLCHRMWLWIGFSLVSSQLGPLIWVTTLEPFRTGWTCRKSAAQCSIALWTCTPSPCPRSQLSCARTSWTPLLPSLPVGLTQRSVSYSGSHWWVLLVCWIWIWLSGFSHILMNEHSIAELLYHVCGGGLRQC